MRYSFFKTVLAVIVGLFLTMLLSTLFMTCATMGMIASLSSTDNGVTTKAGDVMLLKINGRVNEVPPVIPFEMSTGSITKVPDVSLRTYLDAIEVAAHDENIVGIYLNTDGMTADPATYEALRDALAQFRTRGKWVVAYNDNFTVAQYYVSSVADSVFINPVGLMSFNGLSTTRTYPKAFLDKYHVELQVLRVGEFKSAMEPYMFSQMSEANRLQTEVYLKNIWHQMASDIAATRSLTVSTIDSLANQPIAPLLNSKTLLQTRLVDGFAYKDEVEARLCTLSNNDKMEGHLVAATDMATCYDTYFPAGDKRKVAVLYAVGEIMFEKTGTDNNIYYEDFGHTVREITEDETVDAVVLRVNSPGGSVFASEQIWKALSDLKKTGKPLVVSMGGMAASGGYYISCPADYIVAEPNTLTGSIGIFGVIPNLGGLLTGDLGIRFEEVKTHQMGEVSITRPLTELERGILQTEIEDGYDLFTRRCAEGRNVSQDSIKAIAGGRVWTGSDAYRIGLVDTLGNLNLAIAKAANLAEIPEGDYVRVIYPAPKSTWETMSEMFSDNQPGDLRIRLLNRLFMHSAPSATDGIHYLETLTKADRVQARSFESVLF